MNRRSIALLNRALRSALACAIALAVGPSAQCAPLAKVILEGRNQGTTDWLRHLVVAPGDVVEYRLLADMQPIGATNGINTINSLAGSSGIQSLSLAIVQAPTDRTQVDFAVPPPASQAFRNGWGAGTGASTGALSPRTPGGWNDVRGIRPIHSPGVFSAVDPEVIVFGGTFTVAHAAPVPMGQHGLQATLTPTWGTGSGALRINGAGSIFIRPEDQAGPDPLVGFEPLFIVAIPEPSTIAMLCVGLTCLIAIARRRRLAAAAP